MKQRNFKKWTPIEIMWVDSTHSFGWKFENDVPLEDKHLPHKTVGYFRGNTEQSINVVQSYSVNEHYDGTHSVDACMQIPWCAITKIKKLV